MLEQNVFKNLQLPVIIEKCKQITNIIVYLYKKKLQLVKTRNVYDRTDLKIL